MPERAPTPVPEKMIRQLTTPDHTLGFYTEMVSFDSPRYQALSPIKRGTIYAAGVGVDQRVVDAFPTLYFCKQLVPFGSTEINSMPQDKFVIWVWATAPDAESSYNAEVTYLGDAIANPAYARVYTIRRDAYEITPALALGSPLTALIAIRVTASGSGYTTATVGISGGGGSGATAQAVLDANGGVSAIIITAEGTGYTTAPTIAITGNGTGATATGIIQSQSAILTSQKKIEMPDNDPLSHEFVRVLRTYEILPGPYLPATRWDELLGAVQMRRRAVVWASQAATLSATGRITYEAREGSSYVAWEIEEVWSNGTGGAGNPAYPILTDDFHDNDRGEVQRTTQLVVRTGSEVSSSTHSGGVITKTDYQAFNQFLLRKIIETWSVPRTLNDQDYDERFDVILPTVRKREASGTSIGTARTRVRAVGDGTDISETVNAGAIQAAMDVYVRKNYTSADFRFPDQLLGISVEWETSVGEGESSEFGSSASGGVGTGSGINISNSAQGSAAVVPEIIPDIKPTWAIDVPVTDYFFLMPNAATEAEVLTRLSALAGASILAWPTFKPKPHTFILRGQKASGAVHASVKFSQSVGSSGSALATGEGEGESQDFGSSIRAVTLPQMIHGAITLTGGTTNSELVIAAAEAGLSGIGLVAGPRSSLAIAEGSVTPTSLASTGGNTSVPTSGLRAQITSELYRYGYSLFRARVLNFAIFA